MAGPSSEITKGLEVRQHFYTSLPILTGIAGATIAVGDVLEEDTAGLLALADTDDVVTVVGVAMSAGTAAAATVINYVPAWSGIIWEATLDHSSTTGHVLVVANRLQQFGLGIDSGNSKPYVAVDEVTATLFNIVNFVDPLATVRARVLVTFLQNKTVWGA